MSRSFEDVEKLVCEPEGQVHECRVTYGDNYQTDVTVEGVLVDSTKKLEFDGGTEVELEGKDCKKRGEVLVCD